MGSRSIGRMRYMGCVAFLMVACVAQGAAIPGSAGTVEMNDGPNAEELFFNLLVHFEAFDGQNATDPLGLTPGETQYAYILEYVDGNEYAGRFDVESKFGFALIRTGIGAVGTVNGVAAGTEEPPFHGILELASENPGARFLYTEFGESLFGPAGAKSVILVYTASSDINVGLVTGALSDGSLAAADSVVGPVPPGDEGCTPGYWKNHTDSWPSGFQTNDDFDARFQVDAFDPNITLLDALKRKGGKINALARHAAAALLNAALLDLAYPLTTQEVIDLVKAAVEPDGDIGGTKEQLETVNDQVCPLN